MNIRKAFREDMHWINAQYDAIDFVRSDFDNEFIAIVEDAQQKVIKGLDIKQPILVLSSDESYKETTYAPEAEQADLILWVEHIEKYAPNLGKNVTYSQVPDAMHDVFLSAKEVRTVAFEKLGEWLKEVEE